MSKESLIEEITQKDGKFPRMCLFSDTTVVDMINKHLPDEPYKIKNGDYVIKCCDKSCIVHGIVTCDDGDININGNHYISPDGFRLATPEEREFLEKLKSN